MDAILPEFHNDSIMTEEMFPNGLNVSMLLAIIQNLSPEARKALFIKMGMGSEDELRQLVGGALVPTHVSIELERMRYPEYRAHKLLRLYVPPVLLLLGTFGNIFSFLILRHKAMARQSTHHFLAALAVVDSLVLYVGLFRKWLGDLTGFDPQNQSEWLCKSIVMLGYTCSNVSVWIIVAVTVERYIVVCHPLKASMVCNVTRAKRVVLAITALFVVINLHFLWTASLSSQPSKTGELRNPECNSEEGHEFLITAVWPWVDAMLYGLGPFAVIFILNIFIIVHVVRATSGRVMLQNRSSGKSPNRKNGSQYQPVHLYRSASNVSVNSNNVNNSSSSNNNNNIKAPSSYNLTVSGPQVNGSIASSSSPTVVSNGGRKNNRRFTNDTNLRMTVMLLTVSFTFLLTTLPMNVSVIASGFWNQESEDLARMSKFQLVFTIAEMLMYLNHSVNFFLYCATGHKFRSEMIRMVCGKQRPNSALSDHSQHLYCSRNCVVNGFVEIRNTEETEL